MHKPCQLRDQEHTSGIQDLRTLIDTLCCHARYVHSIGAISSNVCTKMDKRSPSVQPLFALRFSPVSSPLESHYPESLHCCRQGLRYEGQQQRGREESVGLAGRSRLATSAAHRC
jgi:hypothetical protein